ncbi:hypothetical protein U9M48_000143 [Paspalum notatum var. saurae]|uniref:Uncharacterized protein n=1 Tax=Paspalum notatum var. saurae TaxID=547442 RepID=A0AAQ3PLU0_PASNO
MARTPENAGRPIESTRTTPNPSPQRYKAFPHSNFSLAPPAGLAPFFLPQIPHRRHCGKLRRSRTANAIFADPYREHVADDDGKLRRSRTTDAATTTPSQSRERPRLPLLLPLHQHENDYSPARKPRSGEALRGP